MRPTSLRFKTDPQPAAQRRLAALAALRDTAHARLERSPGFLASLDPVALADYLANDAPEVLGIGPRRKLV